MLRTASYATAQFLNPSPELELDESWKESIPLAAYDVETVVSVHHWSDRLFSFRTTRSPGIRFESGQFLMLGLEVGGKPLMRAYSVASANYESYLEFLSIKVPNGPLTSRLQLLRPGEQVLIGHKPVGTLMVDGLLPGKSIYLFSTGTGLAPFLSIVRDPRVYERFESVVLVHCVREIQELAYKNLLQGTLYEHELVGPYARERLIYVPTVTRQPYETTGRITELLESGRLSFLTNLPELDGRTDRVMLCGSIAMTKDLGQLLERRGLAPAKAGHSGHYLVERAFVEH